MRRGDPHDRAVEVPERLVGDDRGDLGAPPAGLRVLLDREQPAGRRHRRQHGGHVEGDEAAQVDHRGLDALGGEPLGRGHRPRHHQTERHDRAGAALAEHLRRAEAVDDLAVGHVVLRRVEPLVLEEQHRVGIADRGRHQTDDVGGVRRGDDLDPRYRHRPVLHALAVLGAEAHRAAVAGPDHQRAAHLPVGHVARLGDLVDDHVPADGEEVREHDLGDRAHAGHRRAHRRPEDRLLGDRRVDDRAPVRTRRAVRRWS